MSQWLQSLKIFILWTLVCGVIYPLSITLLASIFFADQSRGSLLLTDGKVSGSRLIAVRPGKGDFWPRPSVVDYGTFPSGASNQSLQSQALKKAMEERAKVWYEAHGSAAPSEMLFASASGLDPHISPSNASLQAGRIARERNLDAKVIEKLIADHTEKPVLGLFGRPRVNVQMLNHALDNRDG